MDDIDPVVELEDLIYELEGWIKSWELTEHWAEATFATRILLMLKKDLRLLKAIRELPMPLAEQR